MGLNETNKAISRYSCPLVDSLKQQKTILTACHTIQPGLRLGFSDTVNANLKTNSSENVILTVGGQLCKVFHSGSNLRKKVPNHFHENFKT